MGVLESTHVSLHDATQSSYGLVNLLKERVDYVLHGHVQENSFLRDMAHTNQPVRVSAPSLPQDLPPQVLLLLHKLTSGSSLDSLALSRQLQVAANYLNAQDAAQAQLPHTRITVPTSPRYNTNACPPSIHNASFIISASSSSSLRADCPHSTLEMAPVSMQVQPTDWQLAAPPPAHARAILQANTSCAQWVSAPPDTQTFLKLPESKTAGDKRGREPTADMDRPIKSRAIDCSVGPGGLSQNGALRGLQGPAHSAVVRPSTTHSAVVQPNTTHSALQGALESSGGSQLPRTYRNPSSAAAALTERLQGDAAGSGMAAAVLAPVLEDIDKLTLAQADTSQLVRTFEDMQLQNLRGICSCLVTLKQAYDALILLVGREHARDLLAPDISGMSSCWQHGQSHPTSAPAHSAQPGANYAESTSTASTTMALRSPRSSDESSVAEVEELTSSELEAVAGLMAIGEFNPKGGTGASKEAPSNDEREAARHSQRDALLYVMAKTATAIKTLHAMLEASHARVAKTIPDWPGSAPPPLGLLFDFVFQGQ